MAVNRLIGEPLDIPTLLECAVEAEAVVFFDTARAATMGWRRKRSGQLWSKHRFLAAQMEAYLSDGLWLDCARHSNAMAARLATGLAALPQGCVNALRI